jgi:aldehyde dehydrogenase (NAD+)
MPSPHNIETRHFINNQVSPLPPHTIPSHSSLHQYIDPTHSGEQYTVFNPTTEEPVASFHEADSSIINTAVSAARKAFKGPWSTYTGSQRAKCMLKFADLLEERAEEFVHLDPLCMGIDPVLVQHVLIPACVEAFRCT